MDPLEILVYLVFPPNYDFSSISPFSLLIFAIFGHQILNFLPTYFLKHDSDATPFLLRLQ